MAKLFTDNLSPAEVQRRVGDMRQLAGAEPFEFSAGNQRGVRAVRLYNAAGLDLDVIAERGMGLGRLAFQGAPLAWMSPTGMVHPTYLEGEPLGWLRNFPGGFLTPCGLTQVGSPGEDNGEKLGIHGRLSNLAAENLSWGAGWQDGRYIAWAQGAVREARVFGENLLLTRRVSLALDEPRLWIEDRVENQGFSPAPHMFLQHINLGFPLLGPETRLQLPAGRSVPRDDDARDHRAHRFRAVQNAQPLGSDLENVARENRQERIRGRKERGDKIQQHRRANNLGVENKLDAFGERSEIHFGDAQVLLRRRFHQRERDQHREKR